MRAALLGVLLCVAGAAPGYSDEACGPLQILTSVDMTSVDQGHAYMVPVTLRSKQGLMLIDTGGLASEITGQLVDELGLTPQRAPLQEIDVRGVAIDHYVSVPVQLGRLSATRFDLMVNPDLSGQYKVPGFAGILGPDLMRKFDVDMDFGTGKFNLISPDHCPGKVIYWQADAIAVVPMRLTIAGHIIIKVQLDGKEIEALFDTGATQTTLERLAAESIFGLKMGTTDTPSLGEYQGQVGMEVYRHTFDVLNFEGVGVGHPTLDILADRSRSVVEENARPTTGTHISDSQNDESNIMLILGMNIIRHFHVYIDYKRQVLYITPAGTPPAQ